MGEAGGEDIRLSMLSLRVLLASVRTATSQGTRSLSTGTAELLVSPMGLLQLRTAQALRLEIDTENQTCDRVSLKLNGPGHLTVEQDGSGGAVVSVSETTPEGVLTALIPEKFSVDLSSTGGHVSLARLEGNTEIKSSGGEIQTDKLSEGRCTLSSNGGAVHVRVMNCSTADINTGGGAFTTQRVQTPLFNLQTAGGAVDIRAAYVGSCSIASLGGAVTIGSLHGDTTVVSTEAGDLNIESGVDGELNATATTGNLAVHLGDSCRSVHLESEQGHIKLSAPGDTLIAEPIEFRSGIAVEVDPVFDPKFEYDGKVFTGRIEPKKGIELAGGPGYRAGILAQHTSKVARLYANAPGGRVSLQGRGWLDSILKKTGKTNLPKYD